MASGAGDVPSFCWSIIWLLFLAFIGFWLAGFCAFWYIIFSVFTACCPGCEPATEFLLKGVKFAGRTSQWMVHGTPVTEAFK